MKEEIWAFLKLFSFLFYLIRQKRGLQTCTEIRLVIALTLFLKIVFSNDIFWALGNWQLYKTFQMTHAELARSLGSIGYESLQERCKKHYSTNQCIVSITIESALQLCWCMIVYTGSFFIVTSFWSSLLPSFLIRLCSSTPYFHRETQPTQS